MSATFAHVKAARVSMLMKLTPDVEHDLELPRNFEDRINPKLGTKALQLVVTLPDNLKAAIIKAMTNLVPIYDGDLSCAFFAVTHKMIPGNKNLKLKS